MYTLDVHAEDQECSDDQEFEEALLGSKIYVYIRDYKRGHSSGVLALVYYSSFVFSLIISASVHHIVGNVQAMPPVFVTHE